MEWLENQQGTKGGNDLIYAIRARPFLACMQEILPQPSHGFLGVVFGRSTYDGKVSPIPSFRRLHWEDVYDTEEEKKKKLRHNNIKRRKTHHWLQGHLKLMLAM
jgi:hypothetical protein